MIKFISLILLQCILLAYLALLSPSVLIVAAIFLGFIVTPDVINATNFKSSFDFAYVFGAAFVLLMISTYFLQIGICTTVPDHFTLPFSATIVENCLTPTYFQMTLLALWFHLISSIFMILGIVGRERDLIVIVMMFLAGLIFTSLELFESKSGFLVMFFFGIILTTIFFLHRTYSSIWHLITKLGIYLCLYGLMNAMSKVIICTSLNFWLDQDNLTMIYGVCRPESPSIIISTIFQTITIFISILPLFIHYIYYVSYKNQKIR